MGFYPDVTKGDKFRPSAALENDVRHLINSMNGFVTPGTNSKRNHEVVAIINMSDVTLQEGMIVNLEKDGDPATGAISAVPVKSVDEKWGIVTGNIDPMTYGSCIISGVVSVPTGAKADYLEPDLIDPEKKKFKKSEKGGVRMLSYFHTGEAIINLGEGRPSSGDAEYKGYFKVVPGTEEKGVLKTVKIIDGAGLVNSLKAGSTDIGSVDNGEVDIPSSGTYHVYLILEWDGNAYKQYFSTKGTSVTDDAVSWLLADGVGSTIVQRWTGGTIYWGSRYFI